MNHLNLAVYAQGCLYPVPAPRQSVADTVSKLKESGFNTVILGLFHIGRDTNISPPQVPGDLYFNDTLVISKGEYVGDPSWPGTVASLPGDGVTTVCASIGGGYPVFDFTTLQAIYTANGNSFENTNLKANFVQFRKLFPAVSIIDMDCEDNYDQASLVAFCQMLAGMGFGITFCPYQQPAFWAQSLNALNTSNPGVVRWWNLQCYAGGGGNEPDTWAESITQYNKGFSTDGFLFASDWTEDRPDAVQELMASYNGASCLGGGFMWTLDDMVAQGNTMQAYASAMANGLRGTASR